MRGEILGSIVENLTKLINKDKDISFKKNSVQNIVKKKSLKLVRCIFFLTILNKCTKYFLQQKSVQNIVKKRHKIG